MFQHYFSGSGQAKAVALIDADMAGWLEQKVALVTGGATGIGRGVVDRFVAEGARVVVFGLPGAALEGVVAAHGDRVAVHGGDVTRPEDNEAAVALALRRFGRLDVFVGNAGVFDGFAHLSELSPAALAAGFDEIFGINVKGALFGARAALGPLQESGGNMIFTLSNAAFHPAGGGPLYTASKHALVGIIRQLAHELAPRIRVNGVAPGGTTSAVGLPPSLQAFAVRRPTGEQRARLIGRRTMLGFAQEPADHAGAYVLLASSHGRAITGVVIPSDGGIGVRGMPGDPAPEPFTAAAPSDKPKE